MTTCVTPNAILLMFVLVVLSAEHLPEFRLSDERYTSITIQQLLDNTSGLRDTSFDRPELNRNSTLQS